MKELIKLVWDFHNVDGNPSISKEEVKQWVENYYKGKLLPSRKIELADAIIEEASFNNIEIDLNSNIEHQLGTVWVGNCFIQPQETVDIR